MEKGFPNSYSNPGYSGDNPPLHPHRTSASAPRHDSMRRDPSELGQGRDESDIPFAPGFGPLTPAYTNQDADPSASNRSPEDSNSSQFRYTSQSSCSSTGLSSQNNSVTAAASTPHSAQGEGVDKHSHFFVNTEIPAESYQQRETDEFDEYPVPVTFVDRKSGTVTANGEPIAYPDTLPTLANIAEDDNPTGYSQPSISSAGFREPSKKSPFTNRPYDEYTSPAFANPMANTAYLARDPPPPSYPQAMGDRPYAAGGYSTGYSQPGNVHAHQFNGGWTTQQSTHVNVVTQPAPDSMIIMSPASSVPDYTVLSWVVCCCCCWPLGLVAISKSNEAKRLRDRGNIAAAKAMASEALCMSILSIVLGIIIIGLSAGIGYWRVTSYYT